MKYKLCFPLLMVVILVSCETNHNSEINALFEGYSGKLPGAAAMVIQNGDILYQGTFGMADIDQGIAVSDSSNFRLASVTKQFTAMAILQLMDDNQLNFNTSLREIFPAFPMYAADINYGHLLHHTSGLLDYEGLIADSATVPVRDADVLDLLLLQDTTRFLPGSDYSYNNGGYALLALTVERISGMPFQDYLKENIFKPLQMHTSVAFLKGYNEVPNRAYGYYLKDHSILFSDQSMTSSVLGDGGIYTSLKDMYKWDQALYGTTLVSQAMIDSAFTPWLDTYGCGWRIEPYKGHERISHTGSTCGFRNVYQRFPDSNLSIVVLTNRRDPGVQYLAEAIADLYL
mgnify:CR=1 FL=1